MFLSQMSAVAGDPAAPAEPDFSRSLDPRGGLRPRFGLTPVVGWQRRWGGSCHEPGRAAREPAGPGSHAVRRDAGEAPGAGHPMRRGKLGPDGRVGTPPSLARAAIDRGRRADGCARDRQRRGSRDRGLHRADGGPRHLAGAAGRRSRGVPPPARRNAATRRDVVRPLGPGTAAAEHAPANRRLPAAACRLQCREPGSHTRRLCDTPDHGQPGGLGGRGTDVRHRGHDPRRGRQ